ncbi:MAG: hypothetical protein GW900_04260 [Gammaproteobacteria bacterium]|nr:hypothetical protein [Gammaproteobacteria bacterium]
MHFPLVIFRNGAQARMLRPKLDIGKLKDGVLDLAGFVGLVLWTGASLYALSLLP